ncbi:MAG: hypothetical protein QGG40_21875, partial [Myxococcota bacterium]|nr:hypothetical protein [Myxococcota bacterium]
MTLAGALLLVQTLLWAAPGDPIDLLPNGEELRDDLEREWGLDRGLAERALDTLRGALTGDLGTSLSVRPGTPVYLLVRDAALRSATWGVPALLLSMLCSLVLAWFTAGRSSLLRRGVQFVSVTPVFLLAFGLVVGINELTFELMQRGLVERPDWFALPDQPSWVRATLAVVVLAVGSSCLTELHAACEDELQRVRRSGFVDAARGRGVPTRPHLLLNLVPPLCTVTASRVGFLVGGLVILEKILLLNGAGALMW